MSSLPSQSPTSRPAAARRDHAEGSRPGHDRPNRPRPTWTRPNRTRPPRTRPMLIGAALLALPLAAGCGAGFNNATQSVRQNSASGTAGNMAVNNVWVVLDPTTGNAEVIGAVANTGTAPDRLTSVQASGSTAMVRVPSPAAVAAAPLPLRGVAVIGDTVSVAGGSSVTFGRLGRPELEITGGSFQPGRISQVTFDFATAGPVTMNAQIMPNTGLFAEYDPNAGNPTSQPTPTPTPTPKATPTGTATATPTATGTATATAKPTPTGTAATATATPTASATNTTAA